MLERLTKDYVIMFLNSRNAKLLSDNIGNRNYKLHIQCSCGENFYRSFSTIERSDICLCDKCTNKIRKSKKLLSYNTIKKYIEDNGYKLLSKEYKGNRYYIEVMCPEGHIYNVKYNNFQQGQRCPICKGGIALNYNYVKNYINNVLKYELLSEFYFNAKTKLKIKCDKGHIYETTFDIIHNHNCRCPVCFGNKKYSYTEVKSYIENHNYKLLSNINEYKNVKSYILLECPKGHVYRTQFSVFQQNHRCPKCKRSIGEEIIYNFLIDNKINFTTEHTFDDCIGKVRKLPFDFYLEDSNTIIEYDGEFHYNILFNDKNRYELTIKNDDIKNKYCKINNIKLIRIPYWEKVNIKDILSKELLNG